jgi:rod shape-determining protein MreD
MPRLNALALPAFIVTVSVAMVLRVIALTPAVDVLMPDWIALVLIYWSIALPERFGVFFAWMVGLLTDVLTGRLLGQYALIYSLLVYFSLKEHRRLRQFPVIQQCLYVFICLLGAQSIVFGAESMQANSHLDAAFWYPAISGTLLWPVVFYGLRYVRVMARIA